MKLVIGGLALLFVLLPCVTSSNSIQVEFSQASLQYMATVACDYLQEALKDSHFPDVNINDHDIQYTFADTYMSTIGAPSVSINLLSDYRLGLGVGIYFTGTTTWSYQTSTWIKIKDHGHMDFSSGLISGTAVFNIGSNESGHPKLSVASCDFTPNDPNIKVYGSKVSWIYNVVSQVFVHNLKKTVSAKFCSSINARIASVNTRLKTIFTRHILTTPVTLLMAGPPRIKINRSITYDLLVGLQGNETDMTSMMAVTSPMSQKPVTGNYMVTARVSSDVINLLLARMFQKGEFSVDITKSKLPVDKRFLLNITCPRSACLGNLLNQLQTRYENKTLSLTFRATEAPVFSCSNKKASVSFTSRMEYWVHLGNNDNVLAVATSQNVSFDLDLARVNLRITMAINNFQFSDTKITQSAFEDIKVENMVFVFKTIAANILLPAINERGAVGEKYFRCDGFQYDKPGVRFDLDRVVLFSNLTNALQQSPVHPITLTPFL